VAHFFVDINFPRPVVLDLVSLGHGFTLARDTGHSQAGDPLILSTATAMGWVVLTQDRDFIRIHKSGVAHAGIVFTSFDRDFPALALRIHTAVSSVGSLLGELLRINKPA
jgi:hypothetical protein